MTSSSVSGTSSHYSQSNLLIPKSTIISPTIPHYTLPPARCSQSILNIRTDTSTWLYSNSFANTIESKSTNNVSGGIPSNSPKMGDNVMVVVPGSKQVKIGRASDSFPHVHPQVIAHIKFTHTPSSDMIQDDNEFMTPQIFTTEELENLLDARYKASRSRRPFPNIYSAMVNYNKTIQPEYFPTHNDPHAFEWIKSGSKCLVGTDALRLEDPHLYHIKWPMQSGRLIGSARQAASDLVEIWTNLIYHDFQLKPNQYFMVLAIPDLWSRAEIKAITDELLKSKGVLGLNLIQESVACTYGAAISSAIVVDIGAQKTSVVCVEDGFLIPETRLLLSTSGHSVTNFFFDLLRLRSFPFVDIKTDIEWMVIEELAERVLTVQEDDVGQAPSVYEVIVRRPREDSTIYAFKLWEERILPTLAMFEPETPILARYVKKMETSLKVNYSDQWDYYYEEMMIAKSQQEESSPSPAIETTTEINEKTISMTCKICDKVFDNREEAIDHVYETHQDVEKCAWCDMIKFVDVEFWRCHLTSHLSEDKQSKPIKVDNNQLDKITIDPPSNMSLDEAVAWSISHLPETPNTDLSQRQAKLAASLLLIGGWSSLHGLSTVLQHRLSTLYPLASQTVTGGTIDDNNVNTGRWSLVMNVKDLDSRFVSWKGASVMARLDEGLANEQWIGRGEWLEGGERMFRERLAFSICL